MTKSSEKRIRVKASSEYDVIIGKDILKDAGQIINKVICNCKIALITDDIVDGLYAKTVCNSLEKSGFKVVKFVFPNGEKSKNLSVYSEILSFLAKNDITRSDAVVALGGGVVGDMAGFVASTFLRGIKYVQIPTTLLAQIDSSVGGKTAVDLPEGKNLVGAFCQPSVVICDVNALSSLPESVYRDGMGESAKYALLDKKVFDLLSSKDYDLESLIYLCVDYKRRIVEEDEFEGGKRKLLNLGHTLAHGIEKLSGYTISHGKAVAMGLKLIVRASFKHGYIDQTQKEQMLKVITSCVGESECPYSIESVCENALSDKKRSGDYITLVVVHGVQNIVMEKIAVSELVGYFQ